MGSKTVSVRFKDEEYKELETLLKSEGYNSKSDLIRSLIKQKWDEWAEKVLKHAKKHPEEYEDWEKVKEEL